MMNKKGVLFSFMVFLMLTTLLSLHSLSQKNSFSSGETFAEANAFRKADDKYSNLERQAISLTTSSVEAEIDKRILPFSYSIDSNNFFIETELPLRQSRAQSYLEIIKGFEVFAEDTNYARHFDSLKTDLNTPLPESWGGTNATLSFLLLPQCTKLSFEDYNTTSFSGACASYNYNDFATQDINLTLSTAHDFNSLECNFNGSTACPNEDYNFLDAEPYLSILIDDSECASCALSQKTIRTHFDPEQAAIVILSCVGTGCSIPSLDMNFNGITSFYYTGTRITLEYSANFKSEIESLSFSDVNISVENTGFGAKRWN